MTPERKKEIDQIIIWAKLKLPSSEFIDWEIQNLCPEEYFTGRDGVLLDWCERCEYYNQVNNCSQTNCRLKNENSNTN